MQAAISLLQAKYSLCKAVITANAKQVNAMLQILQMLAMQGCKY